MNTPRSNAFVSSSLRRKWIALVATVTLILLASVAAPSSADAATQTTISGTVRLHGGAPAQGASVTFVGRSTTGTSMGSRRVTAAVDGTYSSGTLPEGFWQVTFGSSDSGYSTTTYPEELVLATGDERTGIDGVVSSLPSISGTVHGPDGEPLAKMWVQVQHRNRYGSWEFGLGTATASDGTYVLRGLTPGTYRVRFSDSEDGTYARQWWKDATMARDATVIDFNDQSVTGIDATMQRTGSISGTVLDAAGQSLGEGMTVRACPFEATNDECAVDGMGVHTNPSAEDGTYTMGSVPPGDWRVEFYRAEGSLVEHQWWNRKDTWGQAERVTVVASQETPAIDGHLKEPGVVTGKVVDSTGANVNGVTVSIFGSQGAGEAENIVQARTVDGVYRIEAGVAGSYQIQFSDRSLKRYATQGFRSGDPDYVPSTFTVRSGEGVSMPPTVVRARPHTTGRVTIANGEPLGDTTVDACSKPADSQVPEECVSTKTSSTGEYDLKLDTGKYTLLFAPAKVQNPYESGNLYIATYFGGTDNPDTSTLVVNRPGDDTTGTDQVIRAWGGISGSVSTRDPQHSVSIEAHKFNSESGKWDKPYYFAQAYDRSQFTRQNLNPGTYRFRFNNSANNTDTWFGGSSFTTASDVVVRDARITPDINVIMPGVPQTPALKMTRGDKSATLTWAAPAANGSELTGYKIMDGNGVTTSVAANRTSYKFTGLTNGRTYRFVLIATNALGSSAPSTQVSVVPAGRPGTPARPTAKSGKRYAAIKWKAASANGSVVAAFKIRRNDGTIRTVKGSVRSYKWTRLKKGKKYSFKIYAFNSVGASSASAASRTIKIK